MKEQLPALQESRTNVFANASSFEAAQRMATALSKSTLVPKEYQNNLPNTLIALEIAGRIGASPLMVMQHLYIVHGRPSWSSKFVISSVNSCGRFKPLRFDFTGKEGQDDRTCIAWTVERYVDMPINIRTLDDAKKANIPVLQGPPVSIGIAKKEGWYGKNGSKWQTLPELMLHYRAASFFGGLYAPEVLMGMQTAEEVHDIGIQKDVTPVRNNTDDLNAEFLNVQEVIEPVRTDKLNASIDQAMSERGDGDNSPPVEEITLENRVHTMLAELSMDPAVAETDDYKLLWAEVKKSGNKDLLRDMSEAMA